LDPCTDREMTRHAANTSHHKVALAAANIKRDTQ
jgi:hypothetical protein